MMVNANYEALLQEAALDPPPGVVSDFANPGGSHSLGYGIVIATSIIATVAVASRLVSSTIAKKFVVEDFLVTAALGIFAGNQYVFWNICKWPGAWVHQWNVQNGTLIHILYSAHITGVFYGPIAVCIKVAILTNWLRIFVPKGVRNTFYWVLHTLIWTNITFYTITTITEIFRCWPREKIWNPWYEGGICSVHILTQNLATSVLNFTSDTTILAIPQWVIWRLTLPPKQKYGMSVLFIIGIGAWIMGVVRTGYIVKLHHSEDVTYQITGLGFWTLWEIATGFLIMGIPTFPRIAKAIPVPESVSSFLRSWRGSSRQSGPVSTSRWRIMYRPKSRRHYSVFEVGSELNTHELASRNSADEIRSSSDNVQEPEVVHTMKGKVNISHLRTV